VLEAIEISLRGTDNLTQQTLLSTVTKSVPLRRPVAALATMSGRGGYSRLSPLRPRLGAVNAQFGKDARQDAPPLARKAPLSNAPDQCRALQRRAGRRDFPGRREGRGGKGSIVSWDSYASHKSYTRISASGCSQTTPGVRVTLRCHVWFRCYPGTSTPCGGRS